MSEKTITLDDLSGFIGNPTRYRHWWSKRVVYTEGIRYLIEHGEADWLIDEIVFAQAFRPKVRFEEFQVWYLQPLKSGAAWLTCEDGNSNRVDRKRIPFTDFDIPGLKIWYVKGVIMLPREY